MQPTFPIHQVDSPWDTEIIMELVLYDPYLRTSDMEVINQLFLKKHFVDSEGRIFYGKDLQKVDSFWSRLRIGKQYQVIFEYCGYDWSFHEVKDFLVAKVKSLSPLHELKWLEDIDNAKSISELIEI